MPRSTTRHRTDAGKGAADPPRWRVAPAASRHQGIPRFGRLVLDTVDAIPRGKVMAYGDIGEYLGEGSPRLVASMMSRYGSEVAWHRVLRTDGTCAPEVADRQLPLLREDRTPFLPGTDRVDMAAARWPG